jgi:DNA-binding transcriptional MerR regulator
VIQVYSIKELVQVTGVARTTIHFYLRQGLLPPAQKTAASRSLYTQEHVAILREIAELKAQGQSLAEIEGELRASLAQAREMATDLAAQERERVHVRILATAAEEFARNGYTNTHVTTIMRELGITATLFYGHFPSKRALLAECVRHLARSVPQPAEGRREVEEDMAEEVLRVITDRSRAIELAVTAAALQEVEGDDEEADLREPIRRAIAPVVDAIARGLDQGGREGWGEGAGVSRVPRELIAQALYGAYERAALRTPLAGPRSRREDLLKAFLWLCLAAQAAGQGEIDVDSRLARHADLIRSSGGC